MPPTTTALTPPTAHDALLTAYPLPWTAACSPACALLVAANDATVVALNPDEATIAQHLAQIVNASHPSLSTALAALADTLASIAHFPTDGDAVDALIEAAEAVLAIATVPVPTPLA